MTQPDEPQMIGIDDEERTGMSNQTTEDIADEFMDGGADLDGLSIYVDLCHVIAKYNSEADGYEYDEDSDNEPYYDEATHAVSALIEAGLIRRDLYVYDEVTHTIALVESEGSK